MRTVNVHTQEILQIVRANADRHASDYAAAVVDYQAAAIKTARQNLRIARTGDIAKIARMSMMPSPPTSHASSYERAIRMLELSADATVEMDEQTFKQLVLDEWDWKGQFVASNSVYKSLV